MPNLGSQSHDAPREFRGFHDGQIELDQDTPEVLNDSDFVEQVDVWVDHSNHEFSNMENGEDFALQIENEVAEQYNLKSEEIQEVRNETEIQANLEGIAEKARRAYEVFQNKVGDAKVAYVMNLTDFKKKFVTTPLTQRVIKSIPDEQLLRHPEFLDVPISNIVEELNYYSNQEQRYSLNFGDIQHTSRFLENHPKTMEKLFNDPRVQEAQQLAFTKALQERSSYRREIISRMHMNTEIAQNTAINVLNDRYNEESPLYDKRIYHCENILQDVQLDMHDSRVQELVKKEIVKAMERGTDYFLSSGMNYYGIEDREAVVNMMSSRIEEFQPPLVEFLKNRIDNYHPERLFRELYPDVIERAERINGVDLTEALRNLPVEYRQQLKEAFLRDLNLDYPEEEVVKLLGKTREELLAEPGTKELIFKVWRERHEGNNWDGLYLFFSEELLKLGIPITEFMDDCVEYYTANPSPRGLEVLVKMATSYNYALSAEKIKDIEEVLIVRAESIEPEEVPLFLNSFSVLPRETQVQISDKLISRGDILASKEAIKSIVETMLAYGIEIDLEMLKQNKHADEVRKIIRAGIKNNPDKLTLDMIQYYTESLSETLIKTQQLEWGSLINTVIQNDRYELLSDSLEQGGVTPEHAREIKDRIQEFAEKFPISMKGHTIAVLTSMAEYRENMGFVELVERLDSQLKEWGKIIEQFSPKSIPNNLQASVGMEYEVMGNTARGYKELHKGELKHDIGRTATEANIGRGNDGVFEIATNPTDNPYLLLMEMHLLQQLDFVDFNFNKTELYEKGARGYHLTIGGASGIKVDEHINFLQNSLLMAGWGGVNAGREVDKLSTGRTSNIRQRGTYSDNNQKLFENATQSVELRSLSLDTWEPFERTVLTSYYGAVAVQALETYTRIEDDEIVGLLAENIPESSQDMLTILQQWNLLRNEEIPPKVLDMIYAWVKLESGVLQDIKDHNENFIQNETVGYLDKRGSWVETSEFGGQKNEERFMEATHDLDNLEKYVEKTQIDSLEMFQTATHQLANKCTKITNLFLKTTELDGGDIVNNMSVLDTTKVGRVTEDSDPRAKYQSLVETGTERNGYYYVQGGSEKMVLHAIQQRLLEFKKTMQQLTA